MFIPHSCCHPLITDNQNLLKDSILQVMPWLDFRVRLEFVNLDDLGQAA
jgi:hypothetical protein